MMRLAAGLAVLFATTAQIGLPAGQAQLKPTVASGFTAFTSWTDYGAHQNTATQTVWTDYGAHQE